MKVGEGACPCFWLKPTGQSRLSLRIFTYGVYEDDLDPEPKNRACPAEPRVESGGRWYRQGHDASVDLDIEIPTPFRVGDDGRKSLGQVPEEFRVPPDDPRWPSVCAGCGEAFALSDIRQWNSAVVYQRGDTGELVAHRGYGGVELAGALYDGWWLHERVSRDSESGVEHRYVGPDGIALVAICPNGAPWEVDGPSRSNGKLGPGWTRTGDPRVPGTLTTNPSIIAGDYHGWIRNGSFTDHVG